MGKGNPNHRKSEEEGQVLHTAARSGDLQAVQSICFSNPLAINSRDKLSRTPLHLAAWSGQTEVTNFLCNHKADVGAAAMDDMGAIHFAAQKGHLEVVRILLSSGASLKASNRKGLTPLHYAAQGSHLDLVKYLVRKGASVTAKTKAGKTPLDLANREEVISFLNESQDLSTLKDKTDQLNSKSLADDKAAGLNDEAINITKHGEQQLDTKDEKVRGEGEEKDSRGKELKRKDEEVDCDGNLSKPKKARVALNHLLSADDTHEGN